MSSSKSSKSRAFPRSSTSSSLYPMPVATRTKSHGPPRVLPLPDLPLRSSREGSRAASPSASPRLSSPRGSGDGPFLNVTAIEMVTGRSSDGVPFGERTGSHTASSPPVSSPLAGPSPYFTQASSSRPRASTSPGQSHTRTTGFTPMIVPESRSIPPHTSPTSGDIARSTSPAKPSAIQSRAQPRSLRPTPTEPLPTNAALTDHLYASFLNGSCADVRIWVKKWNVSWMVHKMVLVQASFFRSLFLGGFSETSGAARSRKGKERARDVDGDDDWAGDDVELQFDDPNITRAAFEICLSRLYSTYPQLHIPLALLPTPQYPLTHSFPHGIGTPLVDLIPSLRPLSQLGTPRLLLSLLATAIYIGHAPLLKEVLSMILRTISPFTVGRYLEFAIDGSIGEEEWEGQEGEGARHLRGVGKDYPLRRPRAASALGDDTPRAAGTRPADSPVSEEGEIKISGGSGSSPDDSPHKTGGQSSAQRTLSRRSSHARMPHFYGTASNKIGEAVVCWLVRWAVDIFNVENSLSSAQNAGWSVWGHRGIPAKFVRAALSSDQLFVRDEMERYLLAKKVLEMRRKGWEREFDGTDGDISLLPSRHSSKTDLNDDSSAEPWDEDEMELGKVFAEGIYYSHMVRLSSQDLEDADRQSFDDLATIAADIDPFSDLPFAPLNVLQSAHWAATNLRSRIQAHASQDHLEVESELGVSRSASDIYSSSSRRASASRSAILQSSSDRSAPRRSFDPYETIRSSTRSPVFQRSADQVYHPVVVDESVRLGYNGLTLPHAFAGTSSPPGNPHTLEGGPMPEDSFTAAHFHPIHDVPSHSARKIDPPQSEATSFGLDSSKRRLSDFSELPYVHGAKQITQWTASEPYRFSVEFWGVNQLGDKDRLYSPLHFYAGSWWLVYLQIMRRTDKNGDPQLGIYLQRWDTAQPAPPSSSPPIGARFGGRLHDVPSAMPTDSMDGQTERRESDDAVIGLSTSFGALGSVASGERSALHIRSSSVGVGSTEGSIREAWRRRSDTSTSATGSTVPTSPPPPAFAPPSSSAQTTPSPEKPDRPKLQRRLSEEYKDPRKVVKAYFSIICSSALGTSSVRFNSSPDVFAQSQSWGWKSSALRSAEYLGYPIDGMGMGIAEGPEAEAEGLEEGVLGWTGRAGGTGEPGEGRGNLRASVVLGVI